MTKPEFRQASSQNLHALHQDVAKGLRKIAAHPVIREKFSADPFIKQFFTETVARYIIGKSMSEAADKFDVLSVKGYLAGVEFVGEEISDGGQVEQVVEENIRFLLHARGRPFSDGLQLGFDLSSVGMLISRELAMTNTARIAKVAAEQGATIMISMERSTQTDTILDAFHQLAPSHGNLGLTIQAYMHRTEVDLPKLIKTRRKIRLVKGVYDEHSSLTLPRGKELDVRYVECIEKLAEAGSRFAVATHDPAIIDMLNARGLLDAAEELEGLHGCNPSLFHTLNNEGHRCRITGVYGEEWLLHFLHRLAEHPPNALQALADFYNPDRVVFGADY